MFGDLLAREDEEGFSGSEKKPLLMNSLLSRSRHGGGVCSC
jgi:hypothetical protein